MAVFNYYKRLSREKQAIYRRSDAIVDVPLPENDEGLIKAVFTLKLALDAGKIRKVSAASNALCRHLSTLLEIPPPKVAIRATRPQSDDSELHGLYERVEGETALIQVWMRTASKGQVVAFKTFLRTLLHEVGHHLDFDLFGLSETFHTEGFFRRESNLTWQLLALLPPELPASGEAITEEETSEPEQLSLFQDS